MNISRVHWLLFNLSTEFKGAYSLVYDYSNHKYLFYRTENRKIYDLFVVVRSSKHCFRVVYANTRTKDIQYFSCRKSSICARRMYYLWQIDENDRRFKPP